MVGNTKMPLSCNKTFGNVVFIVDITDLLNYNEFKVRKLIFLFVKMDSNFTSGFLCRHSRLVVAESDLEFIGCGTEILNFTFITND